MASTSTYPNQDASVLPIQSQASHPSGRYTTSNRAETANSAVSVPASDELAAQIEPFDSFWEGPSNIEKGYDKFLKFYRNNYLRYMPANRDAHILIVSCGPGYFVNLLKLEGYTNVTGIDSYPDKISHAERHGLNCKQHRAFEYLNDDAMAEQFDVIFCEQEINHLTKQEIPVWLALVNRALRPSGQLIMHALNGANPITGA